MTGALDPVWPCWNHVQSSPCLWLREEVEPMTELHGRLIGFLDVIRLKVFASDPPRGAAGQPPEDRRGLARAFGLAVRRWQSHPLLWIGEVAMSGNKLKRFTDEFKREAVWLIETSGRKV
jgi:hypothetical protein